MDNNIKDINALMSLGCLNVIGYAPSEDSIATSIIASAKSQAPLPNLVFTENYFYEESVYYLAVIMELEERHSFIKSVMKAFIDEQGYHEDISYEKVISYLLPTCIGIAKKRIELSNLRTSIEEESILNYVQNRLNEYKPKYIEHSSTTCDIPSTDLALGLSPRTHPTTKYLGAISDNISNSVNINENDSALIVLIEMYLLNSYIRANRIAIEYS